MPVLTGFCIMSLLHRKRRQNRLERLASPATRKATTFLDFQSRGLRTEIHSIRNLRLSPQRERKRFRTIIELPYNPARLDFNREVKQAQAIHEYDKRRVQDYNSKTMKPLSTIKLDGSIKVDLPPEHPICVQRKVRRELLFATDKAGKGGQRMRREDNNIQLRCK